MARRDVSCGIDSEFLSAGRSRCAVSPGPQSGHPGVQAGTQALHVESWVTVGLEPPQHGCFHSAPSPALQQIRFILASFLSPSGGGRAGGPGGIHPKWASISFLSSWALCEAELQAVTLQTVINHKLWAVLKCLPRNLLVHGKSEMLLIGFQQLSPFLAQICWYGIQITLLIILLSTHWTLPV